MNFNLSVQKVALWIDTLPNSQPEDTPDADCQRDLKRKQPPRQTQPRKRQQPVPTPTSPVSTSIPTALTDTAHHTPPSTKPPASDVLIVDTDQIPQAFKNRGPAKNTTDMSSPGSDAVSDESKRTPPTPPVLSLRPPENQVLVRSSINLTIATHNGLPPVLHDFIGDFSEITGRYHIIPRRIKSDIEEYIHITLQPDRLHSYMFFDDTPRPGVERTYTVASGRNLIHQALRVYTGTSDCSRLLRDDASWNEAVHTPLLDMFVHDMQDGPGQGIMDYMPCPAARIESRYHRVTGPASRVDYVLRLLPEHDPGTRTSHGVANPGTEQCFNWTTDAVLRRYPIAASIQTKRYGGSLAEAEQQMGVWHAAQWEFLASRAGAEAVEELGYMPGIVVQGHVWSLVITTREQVARGQGPNRSTTTILCSIEFGNTASIIGVFQVIAGLQQLRRWSLDVLWPWYKKHLPGLAGSVTKSAGASSTETH